MEDLALVSFNEKLAEFISQNFQAVSKSLENLRKKFRTPTVSHDDLTQEALVAVATVKRSLKVLESLACATGQENVEANYQKFRKDVMVLPLTIKAHLDEVKSKESTQQNGNSNQNKTLGPYPAIVTKNLRGNSIILEGFFFLQFIFCYFVYFNFVFSFFFFLFLFFLKKKSFF
mgnify:CR=1 FL=1